MTQNQIAWQNAKELERHNRAAEVELNRHQLVMEAYEKWRNALTAEANAETRRANLARESENQRSNIANERIKEQQNAINAAVTSESARHNVVSEALTKQINSSQAALNSALAGNASASAALSYANIPYIGEKTNTEKSQQALNLTKTVSEGYNQSYVLSQTDLNRAKVVNTQINTRKQEAEAVQTGVQTLWDSVTSALSVVMGGRRRR